MRLMVFEREVWRWNQSFLQASFFEYLWMLGTFKGQNDDASILPFRATEPPPLERCWDARRPEKASHGGNFWHPKMPLERQFVFAFYLRFENIHWVCIRTSILPVGDEFNAIVTSGLFLAWSFHVISLHLPRLEEPRVENDWHHFVSCYSEEHYPPWTYHSTWNTGAGKWVSFWEGLLPGAMKNQIQHEKPWNKAEFVMVFQTFRINIDRPDGLQWFVCV